MLGSHDCVKCMSAYLLSLLKVLPQTSQVQLLRAWVAKWHFIKLLPTVSKPHRSHWNIHIRASVTMWRLYQIVADVLKAAQITLKYTYQGISDKVETLSNCCQRSQSRTGHTEIYIWGHQWQCGDFIKLLPTVSKPHRSHWNIHMRTWIAHKTVIMAYKILKAAQVALKYTSSQS